MAPHALYDLSDFAENRSSASYFGNEQGQTLWSVPKLTVPGLKKPDILETIKAEQQAVEWSLTANELREVEVAVHNVEKTSLALNMINPVTFRLPTLSPKLRKASEAIHSQQGHVLIRGLNSINLTYIQKVIAHAGLTCHIAGKRAMTGTDGGDKTVLHHVTALSTAYFADNDYHAPSNLSGPMLFHNDLGDVLSLFTVSKSKTGGEFFLARVSDIYQELLRTRADLVPILTDDWIFESPSKEKGFEKRPILFIDGTHVIMDCSRVRITGTKTRPRPSFMPALCEQQLEALDVVQSLATKLAIKITFQEGDLIAFNNLGMMHARDSFVDDESTGHKRHLLRLIAKDDAEAWDLPPQLDAVWKRLYDHEDKDEKFDIFKNPFMFSAGH